MENKFFVSDVIAPGVTRILGLGGVNCYLVEGGERALLIDGLAGCGSLKSFVRELTDKPVTLALTHGHLDHEGAAFEYEEVYIHPDDIALMYSDYHAPAASRLNYVKNGMAMRGGKQAAVTMEDMTVDHPVRTYPIYDGDVFDLGGREIAVLALPGHTRGTVTFLDRQTRILFSGDAVNINTLLNLAGSTSVEEYMENLHTFNNKYRGQFDCMYGGHGTNQVPPSILDDAIGQCEKIIARTDDAVPIMVHGQASFLSAKRGPDYRPLYGGESDIAYTVENIRRKPRGPIQGKPQL